MALEAQNTLARELVLEIHAVRTLELKNYQSMLRLSTKQRDAIAQGDTDALLKATEEKGCLIGQIQAADRKIVALLERLAEVTGASGHECIAGELGDVAPDAAGKAGELGNDPGGNDQRLAGRCRINTRIAGVLAELLEMERANQAALEEAMNSVSQEVRQLSRGGKAVRAYAGPTDDENAIDESL